MNVPFDSPTWNLLGWTLLHYLWVGAAIGAVGLIFRRVLRSASPQLRYAAALLVFTTLAAAPVAAGLWLLGGQVPIGVEATTIPIASAAPVAPMPPSPAFANIPPDAVAPLQAAAEPTVIFVPENASLLPYIQSAVTQFVRWAPAGWLAGMVVTFFVLMTGLTGAHRLRRGGELLVDGPIHDALIRWSEALGVGRRVVVGVTDRVVAPLVVGILKPTVLLPAAVATGHSPEQIEMILLHELAHVRRADNFVNLLQRIVEAVLFFHPAVWIVSRWVRLEREHCCDSVVLGYTGDPHGYAHTLASLAMPGLSPTYAAAALANHQLVTRIQRILSVKEQTMSISPKAIAVVALSLALSVALVGIAQEGTNKAAADSAKDASTNTNSKTDAAKDDQTPAHGDFDLIAQTFQDSSSPYGGHATSGDVNADRRSMLDALKLANETSLMRGWGPEQATGQPDVPAAGDDQKAWASLTQDDQDEWLELDYNEPVTAVAIMIVENCSPGALRSATIYDAVNPGLQYTWKGNDPTTIKASRGVSIIPLSVQLSVNKVRLELASKEVAGWNEIDAVGLLDAHGKTHWASGARASSTYAERPAVTGNPLASQLHYRDHLTQAQFAIAAKNLELRKLEYDRAVAAQLQRVTEPNANTRMQEYERAFLAQTRATSEANAVAANWSTGQATGAPNATAGEDHYLAWASATPDGQEEWLELSYDAPRDAIAVLIYQTYNPGAITHVCAARGDSELEQIYERPDGGEAHKACPLTIVLKTSKSIDRVHLRIDSPSVAGYNEIDAVGLLDASGQVHWAKSATASSYFGQPDAASVKAAEARKTYGIRSRKPDPAVAKGLDYLRKTQATRSTTAGPRNWGAEQATGAPNSTMGGDDTRAWASRSSDGSAEWLQCTYKTPVPAVAVLVYETLAPATRRVTVADEEGHNYGALDERKLTGLSPGVLAVPLDGSRLVKHVTLTIDSMAVTGWNEIDAVGLLDATGKIHWADEAKASSTYADVVSGTTSESTMRGVTPREALADWMGAGGGSLTSLQTLANDVQMIATCGESATVDLNAKLTRAWLLDDVRGKVNVNGSTLQIQCDEPLKAQVLAKDSDGRHHRVTVTFVMAPPRPVGLTTTLDPNSTAEKTAIKLFEDSTATDVTVTPKENGAANTGTEIIWSAIAKSRDDDLASVEIMGEVFLQLTGRVPNYTEIVGYLRSGATREALLELAAKAQQESRLGYDAAEAVNNIYQEFAGRPPTDEERKSALADETDARTKAFNQVFGLPDAKTVWPTRWRAIIEEKRPGATGAPSAPGSTSPAPGR